MQLSFKKHFSSKRLHIKKQKIKKRLALLYLVSTKNNTVATFVDYRTKQTLAVVHVGYVLQFQGLSRLYRRSLEAHKIYGVNLPWVFDRYFFKAKSRLGRRERRKRPPIKPKYIIKPSAFKFVVYFRGQTRHRRVVLQEFTKRYIKEKKKIKEPDVWNQFSVVFFTDITSIPHNGCRARKIKRTRLKRKPKIFRKV